MKTAVSRRPGGLDPADRLGQPDRLGRRVVRLLPLRDDGGAGVQRRVLPEVRPAHRDARRVHHRSPPGSSTRPIGGVLFGHLGDRLGRKPMLVVTMMIMGLSTFAMGLLPTYDSIGVAAPLLLVLLRMLQGIGLGGEWGGAVLLCVEHAPEQSGAAGTPAGRSSASRSGCCCRPARSRRSACSATTPCRRGLADPVPGQHRAGRGRPVHPAADRRAAGVQGARRARRPGAHPAARGGPPAPRRSPCSPWAPGSASRSPSTSTTRSSSPTS